MLIVNDVYRKRQNIPPTVKSIFQGLIIILIVYALLGNSLRSSRAIILIGFVALLIVMPLLKFLVNKTFKSHLNAHINIHGKRSPELSTFLQNLGYSPNIISHKKSNNHLFTIGEMVFSKMISILEKNKEKGEAFFWDAEKQLIIGSSNKKEKGRKIDKNQLYRINSAISRFNKRSFDIIVACLFFLLLPINLLLFINYSFADSYKTYCKNVLNIWNGKTTFISYMDLAISSELPTIKLGIFPVSSNISIKEQNLMAKEYALHYSILKDIIFLFSHYVKIVKELSKDK